MRLHGGDQHPNFRDISCSMRLLSDDAEWLRCVEDALSSDFDLLAEFFYIIMALSEPESPRRICERTKDLMIVDFRRKHPGAFPNDNCADESAFKVIQNLFQK